jgi:hypothetical protein
MALLKPTVAVSLWCQCLAISVTSQSLVFECKEAFYVIMSSRGGGVQGGFGHHIWRRVWCEGDMLTTWFQTRERFTVRLQFWPLMDRRTKRSKATQCLLHGPSRVREKRWELFALLYDFNLFPTLYFQSRVIHMIMNSVDWLRKITSYRYVFSLHFPSFKPSLSITYYWPIFPAAPSELYNIPSSNHFALLNVFLFSFCILYV